MFIKPFISVLACVCFSYSICSAQEEILYKQIDSTNLFMEVYYPEQLDSSKTYPAMVFFLVEDGKAVIDIIF